MNITINSPMTSLAHPGDVHERSLRQSMVAKFFNSYVPPVAETEQGYTFGDTSINEYLSDEEERFNNVVHWTSKLDIDTALCYDLYTSCVEYDSWSPSDKTYTEYLNLSGHEVLDIVLSDIGSEYSYGHSFSLTPLTKEIINERMSVLKKLLKML